MSLVRCSILKHFAENRLLFQTKNNQLILFVSSLAVQELTLNIVKGKAIPLQTWTGPEGSMGLRLPDFKTVGP